MHSLVFQFGISLPHRWLVLLAVCWSCSSLVANDRKFATADESHHEYKTVVVPFFAKHCNGCHNAKKTEGDLDLASLSPDMKETPSGARWATLVEKLETREMPPADQPQPDVTAINAAISWARAEAKRANKHFTKRAAYDNGNQVAHHALFDPQNIPPYDTEVRVRRLSPEIYSSFLKDTKRPGTTQPFSPTGKSTFADMGAPKVDEPITAALLQNALIIVEGQTSYQIVDGKPTTKFTGHKDLHPLFQSDTTVTAEQVRTAIQYQFQQFLKRKPTADELARFEKLYAQNLRDAGPAFGARYTLAAVLLLPEAIFRQELGTGQVDAKGRVRLAPREIAYALAYALTDKGPDAKLLTAAAAGELDTDEGVARHVTRLLEDKQLDKPRIMRFFREYFGYAEAEDVFKEEVKGVPTPIEFTEHRVDALIDDTDRLVKLILEQDQHVLKELLTTNKSFVGAKFADEYSKRYAEAKQKFEEEKQKNPDKFKDKVFKTPVKLIYESYNLTDFPAEQPVTLPADQRAGILTQPSWLVAKSTTFDNHAIHRGKWIRERLLGGVVPDIPITVDAQLPNRPDHTLRERMKVTQQEYCYKCHQYMNNLGLPFEQYDHYGRYRTVEHVLDAVATEKNVNKKGQSQGPIYTSAPVDTSGIIDQVEVAAIVGKVRDPLELVRRLADSPYVEQVFVRHAFRYWLGRNETPGDAASLQAVHRTYRESNGSFRALVTALLTSEAFLYRVPSTPVVQSNSPTR